MADHSALSPGLNQKKALKIAIPLPGMVEENVGTPFTEIDQTRTRGADQTPPKLPPRTTANNDRPDNSFFRPKRSQSQSHSLIPFSRGFSDQFPLHVKVTQGHYGTNHMETLSGQEELIILYEKRQEVLHVRSKIGKTYSIPFGSSIPISILHNPNDNEAEAVKGIAYESLSDLKKDQLPKVISCNSADKQSPVTQNEILLVKRLDTKNKKLCVHSILKTEDSATEKELDLNCKATFTTKPDAVALYLFDIVKYCNENSTTKMRALLDLDKLSSSNANTIKHMDRSLMEPVDMERKTEDSLVVVRAEPGGDYDNCQLFEIPLEENLPIEVEILEVPQDPLYSSLDPPDYRSKFDPKKLKVWDISRCEASQSIQQIFYSSLRSGHEMDGIDLPQRRYEKVKAPDHQHNVVQPIKVSVPVIPSTEEAVAVAPQLPPKPKPASAALASLTQLSPDLMMKQFQEMLQKAVKKEVGGQLATERMLSVSSDPESCDSLMSPNVIHQQTQAQKLTPDDLYQVITELIDCEGLWYCLGIYLGVPKPKIDEISTIHSYDPKRSLIEVVSYWLNNSLDASWLSIVKALIQSEKRNKAREIAEKFDAEIPSVDIQDTVPLELQGDLSHDEKIQLKKLSKGIEQKSEELQDVKRNTQKNKEKLDRLGQELAEVKRKLRFNEEYALVLANGSQINALKIKELRKSDAMTEQAESMAVRDKQSYERRIRNAQSETTRLQQQLLGIDREHKNVFSQQRVLHEKDSTLHQELLTMEEDLNQLVLGGHDPIDRNEESEETLESPEYYNIILKNGMMEQKMHQKEITQLQEELKIKEDQLISLQEKLSMTQQNLAKVEERLSSKYDYVTVMDTLVTDENLKTSLEADKVDYHLQIANVHFSKREVKSKLSLKEIKMQKSKKLNRIAQNKAHMTSGGNSGSQEDVFLPTPSTPCEEIEALDYDTAKPHAIKTTTTRQEASLAANRPKANFKPSTKAKLKPISQSLRARPPATKPVASRSRAATTDTKLREASSRKPPRNVDGEFRARLGATAKSERPKN